MAVSSVAVGQAVIRDALGIQCGTRAPNPIPRRFCRLTRQGGGRGRELDQPRILAEFYASASNNKPDGPQAEQDALDGYDALRLAANGGPWAGAFVTGWDGNTIADYDNPDFPHHSRWQFTGVLYVRN